MYIKSSGQKVAGDPSRNLVNELAVVKTNVEHWSLSPLASENYFKGFFMDI